AQTWRADSRAPSLLGALVKDKQQPEMGKGFQIAQAVGIGIFRQEVDFPHGFSHQVGLTRDGELLFIGAVHEAERRKVQGVVYHFQKARVKMITSVRYSRRPSSMLTLSTYLAASGRAAKLPSGPMTPPSPGPTFISVVR